MGLALGSTPGLLFGLWGLGVNPLFHDSPLCYLLVCLLLPGLVLGALFGLVGDWRGAHRAVKGLLAFEAAAWLVMSLWPAPAADGVELLVFGIDGATYDVIDPMVEAGELPALAEIQATGTHAVLESMEPMFSPLLWTTMASGRPPEVHGVHGFHVQATDVQVPRFWDVALAEGQSVGIYKWLVTYPPREVDGFIVPAWLAPAPETWPEELSPVKELELSNRLKRRSVEAKRGSVELLLAAIAQGLRFSTVVEAAHWKLYEIVAKPTALERRRRLEHLRVSMDRDTFALALIRHQPRVATFTDYATDGLAHIFWRWHQPEAYSDVDPAMVERYGEVVRDAYRQADEVLAEMMELVGDDARIVVLSDHGFQPLLEGAANRSFFSPKTERLDARLDEALGEVDVSRLGVKLTVAAVDPQIEVEALRSYIEGLLDENGEPFFLVSEVPDAPRSLCLTFANEEVDEERIAAGTVGGEPMRAYAKLDDLYTGDHHADGVFMARGPGIEQGEMERFGLLDVSPTIHGLMGISPAQDMPGVSQVIEMEPGPLSRDSIVRGLSFGDGVDGVNEEQLRALGYIQ